MTQIPISSTGVDAAGAPLAPGSVDPHWKVSGPHIVHPQNAYVLTDQKSETYFQTEHSRWIWLDASGTAGEVGESYTFRLTFDLTEYDPETVILKVVIWGVDNNATVVLNCSDTDQSLDGDAATNYTVGSTFRITEGLMQGLNYLDFRVKNSGGPAGLNVELSLTGEPIPDELRGVSHSSSSTTGYTYRKVPKFAPGWDHIDFSVPVPDEVDILDPKQTSITLQIVSLIPDESPPTLPVSNDGPFSSSDPANLFMTQVLGLYWDSVNGSWRVMVRVWGYGGTLFASPTAKERLASTSATFPPNTGVVVGVGSGSGVDH
ncbi:hypothetical protein [Aquisphaera insulae]|uniref:hypothetical protein n=1 Tax=Aquisphaera insulae TaxID=2712864 RepID=UPI0013EE26D3|nr:hypothetical protein [Aquisphaera insulae]